MANKQIVVPDLGGFADVAIIDVYIKEGDEIALDDPIIALESAKAVTDIPSPFAGKITKVYVKEGDTASEGTLLADIEVAQQEKVVEKEEPIETPPVQEVEQEIKEEAPPAEELSSTPIIGATGGSYHATP